MKRHDIQEEYKNDYSTWQLISFKNKDDHKYRPKQALLITYNSKEAYQLHINIINTLQPGLCLSLIYHYEELKEYNVLFDCFNKFPLFNFQKCVKTLSELRQVALFVKILNVVEEINNQGFFFKFLETREIFVSQGRKCKAKGKLDLDDDCEVFIFVKPENLFKKGKIGGEMKTRKKWLKKQKIALAQVLFELATGKDLKEIKGVDEVLIEVSSTLDQLGHSIQYTRVFIEFFTKHHSIYPKLPEITQAFSSVAFKKKIDFKDNVKLLQSSRTKNPAPFNKNFCRVKKFEAQNLKFNVLVPPCSEILEKFDSLCLSKISIRSDQKFIDTVSLSSIPEDRSIFSKSFCNDSQLFSDSKEEQPSTDSLRGANKLIVNNDETIAKNKRRSLNIESYSALNGLMKNESRSKHQESETKSFSELNEDLRQYNTVRTERASISSRYFKKCGKCGSTEPDIKLDCDHYYHRHCLDDIFNRDPMNTKQIFCSCCFKPIDTNNIQDINSRLYSTFQNS